MSANRVIKEGWCERYRGKLKSWEKSRIEVTLVDVRLATKKGDPTNFVTSFVDIISIKPEENTYMRHCVQINTKKQTTLIGFGNESSRDEWLEAITASWKESFREFTQALTMPSFLQSESRTDSHSQISNDLDPQFSMILCQIELCHDEDSLKSRLHDVEVYQNSQPCEKVFLQKPFAEAFFSELKKQKSSILSEDLIRYADILLDGFDDSVWEKEMNNAQKSIEPNSVDIDSILTISDVLGYGRYGVVRRARLIATGEDVAVKIIRKQDLNDVDQAALMRETNVMYKLSRHPHIIRLKDFLQDEKHYYIVEEIAEGGELFEAITNQQVYSEREAQKLVRTLLYTLLYIHEKGIVHRDLKPENILLSTKNDVQNIKLADFGFATTMDLMNPMKTICGTPGYCAPEIILGRRYDAAVDMWSLGVIAYILLCGYPPFPQNTNWTTLQMVVNCRYTFHEDSWGSITDDAKEFIRNLLVGDPAQRITAHRACSMRWMQFESQRTLHMNAAVYQLSRFNARRRESNIHTGVDGWSVGLVNSEPENSSNYFVLTKCGVRDAPSLARNMIAAIPSESQIRVKGVVYTVEGTWVLLADDSSTNWVLAEACNHDPICIPMECGLYKSLYEKDKALHNLRTAPSIQADIIGKLPSGSMFVAVGEITNSEGVWLLIHKQTLHSHNVTVMSPCYMSAALGPDRIFVSKISW